MPLRVLILLVLSLCQSAFVEASTTASSIETTIEGNKRVENALHKHRIDSKRRIFSNFISDNMDPAATSNLIEKAKVTDATDKEKAALLSTSLIEAKCVYPSFKSR